MYCYRIKFNLRNDNHEATFRTIKHALEYAIFLYNQGATIYSLKRVTLYP